jgi:hypothetical protein
MHKLVVFAFAFGLSGSAALAVPLVPAQIQADMIVRVAGGCGAGLHHGAFGACRPNRAGVAAVPGAIVVAPGPAPCAARHRVCYPDGHCAMVCN